MKDKIKKILLESNLYKAPIDIVKLAHYFGFTILQQELNYDGAIISKKDKFEIDAKQYDKVIILNINQINTRKRFTIAHELAHWFLSTDKQKDDLFAHRIDNLTAFNHEPQINDYASELLMPTDLVKEALKNIDLNNEITPSIIMHMADLFCVSYAAAQVRLEKYIRGI